LIEAHGGTLALESELGFGTTATIRLPKARTVAAAGNSETHLQQAA
jgi:signal transduction histidine kinase